MSYKTYMTYKPYKTYRTYTPPNRKKTLKGSTKGAYIHNK